MHSTRTLTSRNSYWTNSPCAHIGSRKRKKACAWACVRAGERVNLNKSSQICEIQFTVHYQFRLFSPFSRITTIPRGAYTRYTTTHDNSPFYYFVTMEFTLCALYYYTLGICSTKIDNNSDWLTDCVFTKASETAMSYTHTFCLMSLNIRVEYPLSSPTTVEHLMSKRMNARRVIRWNGILCILHSNVYRLIRAIDVIISWIS